MKIVIYTKKKTKLLECEVTLVLAKKFIILGDIMQ